MRSVHSVVKKRVVGSERPTSFSRIVAAVARPLRNQMSLGKRDGSNIQQSPQFGDAFSSAGEIECSSHIQIELAERKW